MNVILTEVNSAVFKAVEQIAAKVVTVRNDNKGAVCYAANAALVCIYNTAKEIGKILDAKENTVLSWLSRGRDALRKELDGGFDDE